MLFFFGGGGHQSRELQGSRAYEGTVIDDHVILAVEGQTLGPFTGSFEGFLRGAAHYLPLQQS